jgi:hypothetical protein
MLESVMPAWIAGIQVRGMRRPETSMSIWIPALNAGMTEGPFSFTFLRSIHPLRKQ